MKTKRQPIVTVLGHVDHGKTTLLDALRKTSVAKGEAGGITQSIGASVVTTKSNQRITFIDTPGHAIFSNMRSRGIKVADIALLIIDGSDGVKPQTKEAIALINESKIPFIVVVTKIDLPSASVDVALSELEKEGVYFEGRGGQTPFIGISAKKGEKLEELIDLISLLADVNEITGDESQSLEAYVIETNKDKGGSTASVVVKNGTLKVGANIYNEKASGRVKGLFDWQNKSVKEILPGEPAKILGFENLPEVGTLVSDSEIAKSQESVSEKQKIDKTKIPLYVKADNAGSLEALLASIPDGFVVIDSGVGDVTESDVLNAKSNRATIFVFESRIPGSVKKLSEMEKVRIERYDIIYELLQRLDQILKEGLVEIVGKAEIIASFPFDGRRVAGCKAVMGRIDKNSDLRLYRGEQELGKVKILSIKKQKQEVVGVSQGEEFGIFFAPQLDFKEGDAIVAVSNG